MATWKRILVEGDVDGSGVISVSSTAPHVVSLGDPTTGDTLLTTLPYNSVTSNDYLLIWDDSASEWKKTLYTSIPSVNLGNSNLTQSDTNRTFDIANGGNLKFIANNNAVFQIDAEDGTGTKELELRIGNAVEAFSDDNNNFGGIALSSTSSGSTGWTDYGIWIEGGFHDAARTNSPLLLAFERSYKTSSGVPQDGDEIGSIEFMAPYYTGSAWVGTNEGSTFYDGEGARYGIITGGILSKTSPTKGYLDLKLRNEITLTGSIPATEETAVLRVDSDGVRVNAAETYDGTDGSATTATNNDYYLATDRGSAGQVLHTDGAGDTYWAEAGPSIDYTSAFIYAGVSENDLPWTDVTTFAGTYHTMHVPADTATGVQVDEGTGITISSNTTTDVILFDGFPTTANNGLVTIQGTLFIDSGTSGTARLFGTFTRINGATEEYFQSQHITLLTTTYGASSETSNPGSGLGIDFVYTFTIGQMSNTDPVQDIKFEFDVMRYSGSGTHSYRMSNLKITITE